MLFYTCMCAITYACIHVRIDVCMYVCMHLPVCSSLDGIDNNGVHQLVRLLGFFTCQLYLDETTLDAQYIHTYLYTHTYIQTSFQQQPIPRAKGQCRYLGQAVRATLKNNKENTYHIHTYIHTYTNTHTHTQLSTNINARNLPSDVIPIGQRIFSNSKSSATSVRAMTWFSKRKTLKNWVTTEYFGAQEVVIFFWIIYFIIWKETACFAR